jgi:L-threonylcarbamoyladenylate synthase
MTLVLKRSELAQDFITGGQDTVGVRVPDHIVALALLEAFEKVGGKGVAAPSANRFGHVSPTTTSAVADELGDYLSESDLVLDGGACAVGIESTIIDCTGPLPRVLRPGAVTTEMIETSIGMEASLPQKGELTKAEKSGVIRVSGSLENHYAPFAKVYLDCIPMVGQGFIALSAIATPKGVIRLASPKDATEFAQVLYSSFRRADENGIHEIVVFQPQDHGIGIAIRDRLTRASNKR